MSGVPESLVDLRDLHTVPRALMEGLRDQGRLVCRLITPYRKHLAQHFSVTYSRIGLPEPYATLEQSRGSAALGAHTRSSASGRTRCGSRSGGSGCWSTSSSGSAAGTAPGGSASAPANSAESWLLVPPVGVVQRFSPVVQ
jgi:hypothetical protein